MQFIIFFSCTPRSVRLECNVATTRKHPSLYEISFSLWIFVCLKIFFWVFVLLFHNLIQRTEFREHLHINLYIRSSSRSALVDSLVAFCTRQYTLDKPRFCLRATTDEKSENLCLCSEFPAKWKKSRTLLSPRRFFFDVSQFLFSHQNFHRDDFLFNVFSRVLYLFQWRW